MSMQSLEREIAIELREVLNNPKLKIKEILEWSTSVVKPDNENEIVVHCPKTGVHCAVRKELDKREQKKEA